MPFEFDSNSLKIENSLVSEAEIYLSQLTKYVGFGGIPYESLEQSYLSAMTITNIVNREDNGLSEYAVFKIRQIEDECNYLWNIFSRIHEINERVSQLKLG